MVSVLSSVVCLSLLPVIRIPKKKYQSIPQATPEMTAYLKISMDATHPKLDSAQMTFLLSMHKWISDTTKIKAFIETSELKDFKGVIRS